MSWNTQQEINLDEFEGMNRAACRPTCFEVKQAEKLFRHFALHYANCPDITSTELVITCALAEVWAAARLFQRCTDAASTPKDAARLYDSLMKGNAGRACGMITDREEEQQ